MGKRFKGGESRAGGRGEAFLSIRVRQEKYRDTGQDTFPSVPMLLYLCLNSLKLSVDFAVSWGFTRTLK